MTLFLRQKIEDDIFQKIYGNMVYFSNVLKRWSSQKKIALKYDASCIFWNDGISSPKIWYFFFGRKMKEDLSQEIQGNMTFSLYMYKWYKYDISFGQKISKMIFYQKKRLKVVDTLDWHYRKSSNDSLYFYRDLLRRFALLLSSQKKLGHLIYRTEIWFLYQFI